MSTINFWKAASAAFYVFITIFVLIIIILTFVRCGAPRL